MTFFVTSVGTGEQGGALGGLAGADARCQELADAVAAGDRTWQAYLSTAPIDGLPGDLVHARDRIGTGPWFNALGLLVAEDVEDLHDGPIPEDRLLTELGEEPPAEEHDILTGTGSDGFALTAFPDNPDAPAPTCGNWTRNDFNGWTWVGHFDAGGPDTWNSAHGTSCDPAGLASTAGSGRTYCFAID
jgi:hypothetical protein